MLNETRVTDPKTGGMKGTKPERWDLFPFEALDAVARVYHYGATKYDDPYVGPHNWRRGYAWSLSFAAMQRHLSLWWQGEDNDWESGHSHLAHAVWHGLTLLWFSIRHKGNDDRPSRIVDDGNF